ncbi:type II toxin-antitoxin system HipA family toxin [Coraliomargarita sp. SDUM461004]|uniref:Type II toxin-antitoxin system HipA family toxin n=1 Tax=Thalassobacterium sedimentorum TaxID=3041258 RepID=A0ABU1AJV2_9BACT|nr:type II toxin-antitoxin system HipA family toxin [Coraliomargarita sp. SDUM461004]MDQ8195099.1 type II toxin-antitoxin system HipA family toxin [Coraliomargarita sp. SDUM461004]
MAVTDRQLHVFLNETPMGTLSRARGGKLSFIYSEDYLNREAPVPLSLTMPLDDRRYSHEKVHTWLWGLLPDNELVLARWAQRFQVSPSSAFGLLEGMGEDCAGAVRFIRPEKFDQAEKGGKQVVTESEIERRLRELRKGPALGREPDDRGQFSLAGAQSKTALQRRGEKWYLPWGREPTTHILKPPRPDIDGHVENEHFCLRLAAALGLSVAKSEVLRFGKETAIAVERYDRIMMNRRLTRVHQEDACQVLGVHPSLKYQSEGGPDIVKVMELMNRSNHPVEDRRRVMEAVVFNYLILGTDAHAKNFSILLGMNQQVRLARLYDIASYLPYVERRKDCRFAMKIGGYYKEAQIQPRHFEKMARSCEFPAQELGGILKEMAERMPQAAKAVIAELNQQGIKHSVLGKLVSGINQRSKSVLQNFAKA